MNNLDLFTPSPSSQPPQAKPDNTYRFDGAVYDHARDSKRLSTQYDKVFAYMSDGEFKTLGQISTATGAPEPSASALLRDMRKERFGSHTVNRRYKGNGLYEYQLVINKEQAAA